MHLSRPHRHCRGPHRRPRPRTHRRLGLYPPRIHHVAPDYPQTLGYLSRHGRLHRPHRGHGAKHAGCRTRCVFLRNLERNHEMVLSLHPPRRALLDPGHLAEPTPLRRPGLHRRGLFCSLRSAKTTPDASYLARPPHAATTTPPTPLLPASTPTTYGTRPAPTSCSRTPISDAPAAPTPRVSADPIIPANSAGQASPPSPKTCMVIWWDNSSPECAARRRSPNMAFPIKPRAPARARGFASVSPLRRRGSWGLAGCRKAYSLATRVPAKPGTSRRGTSTESARATVCILPSPSAWNKG